MRNRQKFNFFEYALVRVCYKHMRRSLNIGLQEYRQGQLSKAQLLFSLSTFAEAFNNGVWDTPWRFSLTLIAEHAVKLETKRYSKLALSEVFYF